MLKTISILYFLLLLSFSVFAQTSVISFGSSWRYLDNGTNQGTSWRAVSFNDSKWKIGNGKFGYGISDATTVIRFGSNPNKKYITTYFRKSISITDPAVYSSFTGNVKRDDGVIVYVNGKEVYRNNMPTGTVSFTTLAIEAADNGTVPQSFTIGTSAFAKGTNVIAVEVHQAKANTPDMAFDLELTATSAPPPIDETPPTVISVNRQNPTTESTSASSLTFRVTFSEKVTGVDAADFTTTTSGTASGSVTSVVAVGTTGSTYDLAVGSVSGEGTIRLDLKASDTGITDVAGNAISGGYTSGQSYTILPPDQTPPEVVSIDRHNPTTETTNATSVTFRAAFSEAVTGVDVTDFVIIAASGAVNGTLASNAVAAAGSDGTTYDVTVSAISGTGTLRLDLKSSGTGIADKAGNAINGGYTTGQTYSIDQVSMLPSLPVNFKSAWNYLDNGSNQGTAWRATSFDDSGWKTGNGKFGYGISDAATKVSYGPDSKKKYITTYFRKAISIDDANVYTYFAANINRDDGAVVYVNGSEVYRNNMPTGTISYITLAGSSSSDNGSTAIPFNIPASAFTNGKNVIAVEVHQSSASSPDLAFDMEVIGKNEPIPVEQPRVLYYEGFESGAGFNGMKLQTSTSYGFTIASAPTYSGEKVGRWELRAGDPPASNGTRAEVLFTAELAQQETWHSYAGYFPSADNLIDYDNEVFNQWHQGGTFGTPMLTFSTVSGRFEVRRRSLDGKTSTYYNLGSVTYDQWVDIVIHLKQHLTDGLMKIWINGELKLDIQGGATMFDGSYGRWKMGIYKSDWNDGGKTGSDKRVWYVDEVKIGNAVSTYEFMQPKGDNISMLSMQATNTQGHTIANEQPSSEEQSDQFEVSPTLVKRGATIRIKTNNPVTSEISISNTTGQILHTSKFTGTTSIETTNLPSGLYLVSAHGKRQLKKQKFIVVD